MERWLISNSGKQIRPCAIVSYDYIYPQVRVLLPRQTVCVRQAYCAQALSLQSGNSHVHDASACNMPIVGRTEKSLDSTSH